MTCLHEHTCLALPVCLRSSIFTRDAPSTAVSSGTVGLSVPAALPLPIHPPVALLSFGHLPLPLPILPKHLRLTARSANLIDSRLRSLSLQHNRAPSADMFPDLSGSSTPPFHNSNLGRRRQARQDVTFHYNGLFDCPFSGFGDVDGTLDLSMHRPRLPSSGFHAIQARHSEHR